MMRTKSIASMGISITMCLFFVSCAARPPAVTVVHEPSQKFPTEFEEKWVVAYASDFSEEELKPKWEVTAGNAFVSDGVLVLRATEGKAEVILQEPCFLSPSVRLEFDAYVADWAEPRDLSSFLHSNYGATGQNKGCEGSYLFQFGAEHNTVNRLRKVGEIIEETVNHKILLEHRHLYHIVAENDRGHIWFEIDGTVIFEWDDPNPLWGPEHCHLGFYTWESEIHIENVKIHHKVPKS